MAHVTPRLSGKLIYNDFTRFATLADMGNTAPRGALTRVIAGNAHHIIWHVKRLTWKQYNRYRCGVSLLATDCASHVLHSTLSTPNIFIYVEAGGGRDEVEAVRAIETDLAALGDVVERMSRHLATGDKGVPSGGGEYAGPSPSTRANAALVQRTREVAHDFKATFRKLCAARRSARESVALFAGGASRRGANDSDAIANALLRERESLAASGRAIDSVLASAADTAEALARQRAVISSSSGRVTSLGALLRPLGGLMTAISARRTRNDSIVAVAIGGFVCLALWLLVLRPS